MAFPLDSKFNELREVVERVRAELVAFGNAVRAASPSSSGGAQASSASAGGGAADRGAATRQRTLAPRADVSAFTAIERATGRAGRQVEGLSKTLNGLSGIVKSLGFEEQSKNIEQFAKSLSQVKDVITGIGQVAPAAFSAVTILGGALAILGGFQVAIKATTGETASLADTIALAALGVDKFVQEGLERARLGFDAIAAAGTFAFEKIKGVVGGAFASVLNTVAKALTAISLEIANMDPALRAALPGLETLGNAVGSLGIRLGRTAASMANDFQKVRESAERNFAGAAEAAAAGIGTIEQASAGQRAQINNILNKEDSKLLFEAPREALGEFVDEIGQKIPPAIKNALNGLVTAPEETKEIRQAAQAASVEWAGAFSEGMQSGGGETVDQAILNALLIDPKKEGAIINSFSDLLENIKNLFKENPIALIGNLFGFAQGGFGEGGGAGFARGGLVAGSAVAGARPSWAHMHAQGLARGGRPRGLHPSDIVPIWVGLREYVVNAWAAARPYALQALEAINSGSASPVAMAAVAGTTPVPAPSVGPGFARGGLVGGGSGGSSAPTPAYVVANEESLQRLISGGSPALFRFFRDNAANIRGELGVGGA